VKFPDDVTELLKRKFKNNHREWLRAAVSKNETADSFLFEINLNIPTEQDALKQPESVRSWISEWNNWQSSNKTNNNAESKDILIWSERRWRSLGTQSVPEKLILKTPDDVASLIEETTRWSRAVDRFKLLVQRWSSLIDVLSKHFNVLADYNDSDFENLCEILSWLHTNPKSNLYIRQVPIAGIDSKWLESRKGLVAELIAVINYGASERCMSSDDISDINETKAEQEIPGRDFYKICGLKPLPQLIRIRILDPKLRKMFGGLGDISAPLEEIAGLDFVSAGFNSGNENEISAIKLTAFIVENIQTALAFGDLENSIVLFGLGYGVDVLGKIPWLRNSRCIYWGDIDTHGFAILNRARSYLSNLETVLMDEATLLSHREFWGEEKKQHSSSELPNLINEEQKLFQSLKNNTWRCGVRLEQERIRWDAAWDILQKMV